MDPVLQVALDFDNLSRAMKLAREAVAGGADWIEAGTPLIKSEGLDAVRALRKEFPSHTIIADMKTLDAGRFEMEMAAKAGADVAVVMSAASEATIRECGEAGRNYGIKVAVDILNSEYPVDAAKLAEDCGVHHVGVHLPIDDQMRGRNPFTLISDVRKAVGIPVAVAAGLNSETVVDAIKAGADILIIGGAITKSENAKQATEIIKKAMTSLEAVPTELYKRASGENVREILEKVSTPNISDGAHRMPGLVGVQPVTPGKKIVGKAVTVHTCPGDWAKPVEAIDEAESGDVIVVDGGGLPLVVWGGLATNSAVQRGLAGAVIYGGVRDIGEIQEAGFPVFASHIAPNAGEPRGLGEIGVPIRIGGILIQPGDWIVGDDNGVLVLPKDRAVEMANRAMDRLEVENRILGEIKSGNSTLSKVMELLRWEKRK